MRVNEKCDVYSFGVVTMEVITGMHPGDLISSLSPSAFSSSSFSEINQHTLLKDVIDQRIRLPENRVAEGVVYIIKIAFACLLANPQSRPTMRQVALELIARCPPLPKSFSAITLEDLMPQTTMTSWEFSKRFSIINMWLFLLMLLSIFVALFVINYFSALYFVSSTINMF